jgi:hypothetical protein
MKTLTFAFDVQLDQDENYIEEGTVVKVSDSPFHLNRWEDSVPVIITEAFSYEGKKFSIPATVEWFMKSSFAELR